MALCGCKGARCACEVSGGSGIDFEGNGSPRSPYVPSRVPFVLSGETPVVVTGTGVVGDPWVITVDTEGQSVTQAVFQSSDEWIKPSSGTIVHVVAIGGGGGGGSPTAANAPIGGDGGSGGAMSVNWYLLDDLPESVAITVATGGAGAPNDNSDYVGDSGGFSTFGRFLRADGGVGGFRGTNIFPVNPTEGGTPPEGGPGGFGGRRLNSTTGIDPEDHKRYLSPTGGGNGMGLSIPASLAGRIDAGDAGWAGEGGDGGATTGANGNDGIAYGGGGGGGAANYFFAGGGDGGDGANGVVVISVW